MSTDSAPLRSSLVAAGAGPADQEAAVAAYRACARSGARGLAGGATLHCAGPARWHAKVTRAAEHTVATAARGAYARTLLFNLLVLLVSGAIVTAHARRTRRLPAG